MWKPIETAPDGEKIIVRDRDRRDEIFVVVRREGDKFVVCWDSSTIVAIHRWEWAELPE